MKYRIFIVEDDETIANLLKKHLSSWGYDVFLAEDFSNILQESAARPAGTEAAILQWFSLV